MKRASIRFKKYIRSYSNRVFIKAHARTSVDRNPGGLAAIAERTKRITAKLLEDAKLSNKEIDAIVVGSMLAPVLQNQNQIATFIASRAGLFDIDCISVDCVSASGAMAARVGYLGVLSGVFKNVIVIGSEQMITQTSDPKSLRQKITQSLAQASDWEKEGSKGETFVSLNDTLMTEYIRRYGSNIDPQNFFYFSENAHNNAITNPGSLLKRSISLQQYNNSPKLLNSKSIKFLDSCPTCNGMAGLILSSKGIIGNDVVLAASQSRNDNITVSSRQDILALNALKSSFDACLLEANTTHEEIDFFEVHDAYSIMAALCLEVTGFCAPGKSLEEAKEGEFTKNGRLPISTFGGLKARGHPVGASGIYQMSEIVDQLTNNAGENQVYKKGTTPKQALTTSFGGAASNVVSHLLKI